MIRILFLLIAGLLAGASAKAQQRIVTAGSAASEIVCELGYCDRILATDRTSQYPKTLTNRPSIGYRNNINAEGILAQNPDLIILEQGYVKAEVVQRLQASGRATLLLPQKRTFANTQDNIRQIARALDRSQAGEALIRRMEEEQKALRDLVQTSERRPKVLCVYARGQGNLQVGGGNSAFSGILQLAGCRNAAPGIQGFKPLNAEALILADPDYILFFDSGLRSIGGVEGALDITGVRQTSAGREGDIIAMNGLLLTNWGPRIFQGARELFDLTHPNAQP